MRIVEKFTSRKEGETPTSTLCTVGRKSSLVRNVESSLADLVLFKYTCSPTPVKPLSRYLNKQIIQSTVVDEIILMEYFQCNFCSAAFKEKRNLQNHIGRTHPFALDKESKESLEDQTANAVPNNLEFETESGSSS